MFILAVILSFLDIYRSRNQIIQDLAIHLFGNIMRDKELKSKSITGASYMLISMFITALCFDKETVIASWLVLIIADSIAALVGKRIGVRKILGKSIEGSTAFLFSAIITVLTYSVFLEWNISFSRIFFASLISTCAEFFSPILKLDDNFIVPISFCLAIWIT